MIHHEPILLQQLSTLLYHLPSVIDDIEEQISHIIRGEDHISNTACHIQIFQALDANCPVFAHHPFLTDQQGKGFGKRIGSLSIENLKNEGYENITILNYLINVRNGNVFFTADTSISQTAPTTSNTERMRDGHMRFNYFYLGDTLGDVV